MYQPPKVIERCTSSRGELQLQQRDEHFEIIYNGTFLMATYNGESERVLVQAITEKLMKPSKLLIGGLGVGFSLEEALKSDQVIRVDVLEIEKAIIDWNERYLKKMNKAALQDPRTNIIHADLIEHIIKTDEKYDGVCLDIDNGPDWTVVEMNDGLYSTKGILALKRIIAKGGYLSFWSATKSSHFVDKLKGHFKHVEVYAIEQPKGEPDFVYVCY
ncbi:spermidine synthase [Alkalihalobacillus pseudalcaliphilus]|uniref:spermidine synthase n=1 Tax=Alkalihalobacillus pseudalcaliphilus TaxID=79884 RepID=UPI00064DCA99|nr:spermine/spermidine synthase [Alkalihalobacillus pseudalcaliphilus]KMK78129.1 spermine/spermidine synthase [Alkalihalobacillus pseudalcaliphilus]